MKTRVYRIALVAVNCAASVLAVVQQQGTDLGISTEQLAMITAVANIIIVFVRQILDSSTPTIPPSGG